MTSTQARVWLILFVFLALVGVVHIPLRIAAQAASVSPASGPPGTRLHFTASGFIAREQVSYWFTLPDGTTQGNAATYVVRADRRGQVAWTWRVPTDAQPGFWLMAAQGRETQLAPAVRFEIVPGRAGAQSARATSIVPATGEHGTRFSFFAPGFQPEETVGFWLNAPDGRIVGSPDYQVVADAAGTRWTWNAPNDAQPGRWQMVARGSVSYRERVIPFDIR